MGLKDIKTRITAPTPLFWKKIRANATKFGVACTGAGTAIYQYQYQLPDFLVTVGKYTTGVGVVIAATTILMASMTVEPDAK